MNSAKFVRFKQSEVEESVLFINTALIAHAVFKGFPAARCCTIQMLDYNDELAINYDPASVSRLENILSEVLS